MKRKTLLLFLFIISINTFGQLTPQQAIANMTRGINIGNTLEPPSGENTWGNPPLQKRAFSDYKKAGFNAIRIPITWGPYTSLTSPYTVNKTWMDRIDSVVTWGLRQKLILIINVHHDSWIKESYTASNIDRFDSIWSQIATRFKDRSDSLIFEIINEPNPLSISNNNDLNKRALSVIRKTNPTRIVVFAGAAWSGANDLFTAAIPNATDNYLLAYYHSYDPYPFGLEGTGSYGSDSDLATTKKQFDTISYWANNRNIPVYLGEFGASQKGDYNSRMALYAYDVYQALAHGIPAFAWDDGGDFPIYSRSTYGFNEVKDILMYTQLESPYKLTSSISGKYIRLSWVNRQLTDSIIIERSANGATNFLSIGKVGPTVQAFADSVLQSGVTYYYRLRTSVPGKVVLSYPIKSAVYCSPVNIIPYASVGNNPLEKDSAIFAKVGDNIKLSPQSQSGGTWSWVGPKTYTASTREISVSNIQKASAGNYRAILTVSSYCSYNYTFFVSVCIPDTLKPYIQVNGSLINDSVVTVKPGTSLKFTPQPSTYGLSWLWSGPNSYKSTYREVIVTNIQEKNAGNYYVTLTNTPACVSKCTFQIKLDTGSATDNITETQPGISIFPNPSDGNFKISGVHDANLQITDSNGKQLLIRKVKVDEEIQTSLKQGIYLLKLTENEKTTVRKLIVN
jgi:Endoglucanase